MELRMSRRLCKPARADMARCLRWKEYGQGPRQARVGEKPWGSLRLSDGGVNKNGAISQLSEWHEKLRPCNMLMGCSKVMVHPPPLDETPSLRPMEKVSDTSWLVSDGFHDRLISLLSCCTSPMSAGPRDASLPHCCDE